MPTARMLTAQTDVHVVHRGCRLQWPSGWERHRVDRMRDVSRVEYPHTGQYHSVPHFAIRSQPGHVDPGVPRTLSIHHRVTQPVRNPLEREIAVHEEDPVGGHATSFVGKVAAGDTATNHRISSV